MILCIIQARMTSTRLPGKSLKLILDKPLLLWVVNRVKDARNVDHVVIATSTDPSDDPIVALCEKERIDYFRGSLYDVVDRFYTCAKKFNPLGVLRITADCPLIDPSVIEIVVDAFLKNKGDVDLVSNDRDTYPHGLDTGIYSFKALERVYLESVSPYDREHITPYIWDNPKTFNTLIIKYKENLSPFRITVDYPEDLELVRRVYEALYPVNPKFSWLDVVDFLQKNPAVYALNLKYHETRGS